MRSFPFEHISGNYNVQPDSHMMDAYGVMGRGSQSTAKSSSYQFDIYDDISSKVVYVNRGCVAHALNIGEPIAGVRYTAQV